MMMADYEDLDKIINTYIDKCIDRENFGYFPHTLPQELLSQLYKIYISLFDSYEIENEEARDKVKDDINNFMKIMDKKLEKRNK
jgi:hypothetical protein